MDAAVGAKDLTLPPAKVLFLAEEAQDYESERVASVFYAAERGDVDMIAMQLEFGMSPNVRDGYGRTPLHLAALLGQYEVAQKLLEHAKCNVNALDAHGRTPLGLAMLEQKLVVQEPVREGKLKVAGLLRNKGGRQAALYQKEYPSGPA
ncbi:ANKRD54 [Symbiodinium natans]|uniref:ANKRD54 protein n=1 Tax=Symbiodinium natans TaxID=878477 RepID=A0A812TZY5_9DINO|nr:ANKRD54 [Symbiodinium natans]